MKQVVVINESRPLKAPLEAGYCVSYLCRSFGLSFRRKIPDDWGLLLVYSKDRVFESAITMFGVFFDLGIVWINDSGEVVDICLAKKWLTNKAPRKPARYILEINPFRLQEFELGDKIRFGQ